MIHKLMMIALAASLLAGCGEPRGPTKREKPIEPSSAGADSGMPGSSPHGMPGGMPRPSIDSPEVLLGSMSLTAPEDWVRKQVRPSPMVEKIAEFTLPRADGDTADGRLTVTAVGGSIDDLMGYWKRQFTGEPKVEPQETLDVAGTKVVLISLVGNYSDQHAMKPVEGEFPKRRVRVAVMNVGGRQYIVKGTGPEKTMDRHKDAFTAFIKSLKPASPSNPPT